VYSNLINLNEYVNRCGENYCIVKRSDSFPNYKSYSDIDILCSNKERLLESTLLFLSEYKHLTPKVNFLDNGCQIHIDVFNSNSDLLDLKFDIFDSVKIFKKNRVKEDFKDFCLKTKIHDGISFIPSLNCEMIIRMLDYRENISLRKDKIKHLHFVQKHNENYMDFLKIWNVFVEEKLSLEDLTNIGRQSKIEMFFHSIRKIFR